MAAVPLTGWLAPAAVESKARPWSISIAVGPEGVERPVLEQDVDRSAHRGGARGEGRRGVQLVGGAGEQDEGEAVAHRVVTWSRWLVRRGT